MPDWPDDPVLVDKSRWNEDYGPSALAMFYADRDAFLVDPDQVGVRQKLLYDSLSAGAVQVLDFGCGQGELSIAMALRGACGDRDIGADLIELSKLAAEHNGVVCEFRAGGIHDLAFDDDSFDLVIGAEIPHQLPVAAAMAPRTVRS